jgi:hypothetical protein
MKDANTMIVMRRKIPNPFERLLTYCNPNPEAGGRRV